MRFCRWIVALAMAACASCSSGAGSGGVVTQPPATPTPTSTPIPAGPRAYSGTRVVSVVGSTPPLSPGAATYSATAVETDLTPASDAPPGTTIDRRLQVTYSGVAPAAGTAPQSETLERFMAPGPTGLTLLVQRDVAAATDLDSGGLPLLSTDTRTVTTTYPGAAPIVPVATGTPPPFPLAALTHLIEKNLQTGQAPGFGCCGETYSADYNRTIGADGSFDETGTNDIAASHAKHQNGDGSATSHDQQAGFSLRDVAVSAPAPSGSGMQLAVTLQTQGRTIGNPPIVVSTYTTPVWYASGPLASATLVDGTAPLPAACALSAPASARRLTLAQTAVDVAGGTKVVTTDQNYVDANGITLCRAVSTITSIFDVTLGALTTTIDDELTLHYTGSAQSSSTRRRETR